MNPSFSWFCGFLAGIIFMLILSLVLNNWFEEEEKDEYDIYKEDEEEKDEK